MLNPLYTTALQTLDVGDVQSPDGRSHPLTALTPLSLTQPQAQTPDVPIIVPGMPTVTIPGSGKALDAATGFWPKHFGARLAVGVVAIGILLIVAFKLAK